MEVPPRLVELAELADSCRTAFLRTADASHWQPARNSPAAKVQAALAARDPVGFMLVSEVVVTYLEIAANHLGGLAVLYRHGEAMFPPLPLARSILELTAHVAWVLGDPSGTADDILARAYLEELNSRETAKQAVGRMHSKDSAAYQRARQEWAEFRDHVINGFLSGGTHPSLYQPDSCVCTSITVATSVRFWKPTSLTSNGSSSYRWPPTTTDSPTRSTSTGWTALLTTN